MCEVVSLLSKNDRTKINHENRISVYFMIQVVTLTSSPTGCHHCHDARCWRVVCRSTCSRWFSWKRSESPCWREHRCRGLSRNYNILAKIIRWRRSDGCDSDRTRAPGTWWRTAASTWWNRRRWCPGSSPPWSPCGISSPAYDLVSSSAT